MKKDNKQIFISVPRALFLAGIVAAAVLVFLSWKHNEPTNTSNKIVSRMEYPSEQKNVEKKKDTERINNMKILFVGDLMEDRYIRQMTEKNHDPCHSFSLIGEFLKKFDLGIANNEGTITSNKSVSQNSTPEQRDHFRFTFLPEVLRCYQENNIKLVSIGNNHILDFGKDGLDETVKNLKNNSIDFFGHPYDPNTNYSELEIPGGKLALVSYNAFFGMERDQVVSQIQKLKNKGDSVIVYCHWGIEYRNQADQRQKDLAKMFIDAGADSVIGSHPHVIEEEENYRGKPIYYSLGNFVFDQYFSIESKKGLGVELAIQKGSAWKWQRHYFENNTSGQVKLSP